MPRCYLGLGGNVGPVEQTLNHAYKLLDCDGIQFIKASQVLLTPAVGVDAGEPFRNSACEIETKLSPTDLLNRLNAIEAELGRKRIVHWGPRTLDIDLLLYGNEIVNVEGLTVPHPACWYRSFVLKPLCEIAPEVDHPVKQVTVRQLSQRLDHRPLTVCVGGKASKLVEDLSSKFFSNEVAFDVWPVSAHPDESRDRSQPSFIFWTGGRGFEELPLLPRLDLSSNENMLQAAIYALQSALG